ncbi:polysaccharide biosynthesis tyrosine autokinase [Vitreoscilla massiliensis]|uniref:Polysaccharide biosynthesis tyrosine autokinase n=1 Tax=Vitreoscilla massiliensis TaxID=1689272 RepID=A0ABY4DY57_9NEIS|nr:polysaccharide biosynthesis tyrosine autokinase [Vitreoscilla massiliensis]UOO88070.1 polysaccharide biosynthesis tyrosine autokinase [Vitreoscilla massiliensis]
MATSENTHKNQVPKDDEIDLRQVWDVLSFNKYKIIASGGVGLLLAIAYLIIASPVYEANALVQVEADKQNQILGDVQSLLGGASTKSDAEINLARSRMVLGRAVEELNTDEVIAYQSIPIWDWFDRKSIKAEDALSLNVFSVPSVLENKTLSLVYLGNKKYTLTIPEAGSRQEIQVNGELGKLVSANGVLLNITKIQAESGQEFNLTKQSKLAAIEQIKSNLSIGDVGKDTGILAFNYVGVDKNKIQAILNSIIKNYEHQDKEFGVLSAGRSLEFIEKQLPVTKDSLKEAEDKLNEFRHKNATLDLSLEAKSVMENLTKIESELTSLDTKEAEVSELFTKDHPNYQALIEKKKVLQQAKGDLVKRVAAMPQIQQDVIRLTRDVEIEQQVYMQLLNKQQEFSIMKASNAGRVRIVDAAVTLEEPIKPKKPLILLLLTAGFAALASLYFMVKSLFNRGISNTETFDYLGVDVLASIPLSLVQKNKDGLFVKTSKKKNARTDFLLAQNLPTDPAVEAIRALRTSVYFTLMEAKNNILMVSGATSGVGKSFVSTNLAVVMAQSAKKVLLVDSDMRKGYVHEMLHQPIGSGLSDVLSGVVSFNEAIRTTEIEGLDFVSRGDVPANPAELLMKANLESLLAEVSGRYDYVILDAPPIMAVTDAAILGQQAGTTLIVARYGLTTEHDIENCIVRFANSNVVVKGAILNGVEKSANNYYAYEAYNSYYK